LKRLKKKFKHLGPKPKIKIKLKRYYEGRLPFPLECSTNKAAPIQHLFKDGKKIIAKETPDCPECKRNPNWYSWKRGDWFKIIEAISKGEDLTDMDAPINNSQ